MNANAKKLFFAALALAAFFALADSNNEPSLEDRVAELEAELEESQARLTLCINEGESGEE